MTAGKNSSRAAGTEASARNRVPSPGNDGGFAAPPKRQAKAALICVVLAMSLGALSQTLVAAILPLIVADLGGFDRYTWAATSYMVAATVAFPVVGSLSDVFGRRRFLMAGMTVFILGSLLVGMSASIEQVIAFRAIQGLGGGTVMTCCYVAIADLFPPAERGKYHGLIGAVYGMASVAGPVLGGVVADLISWEWAFLLIGLAGVPLVGLIARIYPRSSRPVRRGKLDYAGMVALALAVAPLLLAISSGGVHYAWTEPEIILPLAFGLVMAAIFLVIESKAASPIMPLGIYADRVVSLALLLMFLVSLGLYGCVLFLPLMFQSVHGASATASGTLLIPMLLAMALGGVAAGQLLSRMGGGYRIQAAVHTGLMALGMYLMSTIRQDTSLLVCEIWIVIAGLGFGGAIATVSVAVQNHVPFQTVGVATSALQFCRSLGGMLGLAVLGVVLSRRFASRLDASAPDSVRAALSPAQYERLKAEPDALLDPSAAESLRTDLGASGSDGPQVAELLLDTLERALADALNDVFVLVAALTAVSFGIALFFRAPGDPAAADGRCQLEGASPTAETGRRPRARSSRTR